MELDGLEPDLTIRHKQCFSSELTNAPFHRYLVVHCTEIINLSKSCFMETTSSF